MKREVTIRSLLGLLVLTVAFAPAVGATSVPSSSSYRFDETSIGVSSNLLESGSSSFRAYTGAGDTAAGRSSSTSFQSEAGSDTSNDPNLTVNVTSSAVNFGSFSPTTASTAIATFSVTNYTSYGYVVQLTGTAPTYGSHEIDTMAATAVSQPGIEQFGVNLVANTSPSSFGANPFNGTIPNNFGFGEATPNYGTTNQFRYVPGESVAQAPKSSGRTDYTMSYIINVTSITPGGAYKSDQTIIVTGTY